MKICKLKFIIVTPLGGVFVKQVEHICDVLRKIMTRRIALMIFKKKKKMEYMVERYSQIQNVQLYKNDK